jgi:hypothetical protein
MNRRQKSTPAEALVEALSVVDSDPNGAEAAQRLRAALSSKHWMPVEHAARLIAQYSLPDFTQELLQVWSRFNDPGPKLDPGCRAKEAALTALDALEWFDPDPFLTAIRYTQFEPGYGGRTDTGGTLRLRALYALLRQHHSQALLYAGELLADPLIDVRVGAAEALRQAGGPNGACLLAHRLRCPDEPAVLLACASALLELERQFALSLLGDWLRAPGEELREVAALALGQSNITEAAELLIAWFDDLGWDRDFELAARALSLHRAERARRCLLRHVAMGSAARSRAAVLALGARDFDRQLLHELREAAKSNPDASVVALVEATLAKSQ